MGYGDDIMATATARELSEQHPDARLVVGDGQQEFWSAVFENNPRLTRLADLEPGARVLWIKEYPAHRAYLQRIETKRLIFNAEFRARPGELYFSPAERAAAKILTSGLKRFVIIEPYVKGLFSGGNKDWGADKWQQVVNALGREYSFVQLGALTAPPLVGVKRIMTDSFRIACAVLAEAAACALPEGGLHHAAAALGVPGVVVFGGFISPQLTGYDLHTNLYVAKGSPCGRLAPCRHCRRCMESIKVEDVVAALSEQLARITQRPQAVKN